MKLIKRYRNRKLYDTTTSSYVNRTDILDMRSRGESVKIVDLKTGLDISDLVILQAQTEAKWVEVFGPKPKKGSLV